MQKAKHIIWLNYYLYDWNKTFQKFIIFWEKLNTRTLMDRQSKALKYWKENA